MSPLNYLSPPLLTCVIFQYLQVLSGMITEAVAGSYQFKSKKKNWTSQIVLLCYGFSTTICLYLSSLPFHEFFMAS
jgi:hypothetical protein